MRIRDPKSFKTAHEQFHQKWRNYAVGGRGRHIIDDVVFSRSERRSARTLYATNVPARIEFAQAAWEVLHEFAQASGVKDYWFVTLAPKKFAMPIERAARFDHRELQRWTEKVLRGHSFFAVVEAAYYGNHAIGGRSKTISWHTHALVWNSSTVRLQNIVNRVNKQYPAHLPGGLAADVRAGKLRGAAGSLCYMLKGCLFEYRMWKQDGGYISPHTGEIFEPRIRQKKRPIRPGDAVKIARVMGDRTIPELTFGMGSGHGLWQRIVERARQRLEAMHEEHEEKLRSLL